MVFDKMDDTVRLHEFDIDVWISIQEIQNDRQDVETPKNDWGRDDQIPTRRRILPSRGAFRLGEIFKNSPACFDVSTARFR